MCTALCVAVLAFWDADLQANNQGSSSDSLIPSITQIDVNDDGELVVSGEVSFQVQGKTRTAKFDDVVINLELAEDQTGATTCPILDITLDPISFSLRGLLVETSQICLNVTPEEEEEIGEVLCEIGELLEEGTPLDPEDLSDAQLEDLQDELDDLLNAALQSIGDAKITDIDQLKGRNRNKLTLELEPLDTTLEGQTVTLDDCEGGPVTVEITVRQGHRLGNQLNKILRRGGDIEVGSTLEEVVDALLENGGHKGRGGHGKN